MGTTKWMISLLAICSMIAISGAQECSEASSATIEKISPLGSRIIVDYGKRKSCVNVRRIIYADTERKSFSAGMVQANNQAKSPPKPLYDFVHGRGYYKLHNKPKSWDNAKKICEREGAHLAVVNSREEGLLLREIHDRLPKLVTDWRKDYAYIGVTERNGTWTSIFGEPLEHLGSRWDGKQPKPKVNAKCAMFHTVDGLIHNQDCDVEIPFFCEREF